MNRTSQKTKPILLMLLLCSVLILMGCRDTGESPETNSHGGTTFDLEEAKMAIHDKTNRFTRAHITRDTAFLNSCFTKDARVYPPNSDAVVGIAAIAQLNTDWVNYGIHEFTEVSTSFYGDAQYLIDEGTYSLRYGEENSVDKGKYINIWKMEDGQWKIYSNIWNSSLP